MAAPLCPSQQPIAGLPQRLWPSSIPQVSSAAGSVGAELSPLPWGPESTGHRVSVEHKALRTAEERASKDLCPDERGDRGPASALDLKLETVMWELPPTVIIPVVIAG